MGLGLLEGDQDMRQDPADDQKGIAVFEGIIGFGIFSLNNGESNGKENGK